MGDDEHAEARRGGVAEERRGDGGGVICVCALLEKGFWCLRGEGYWQKNGGQKKGRKRGEGNGRAGALVRWGASGEMGEGVPWGGLGAS